MARQRDFKAEYQRRTANAAKRGLSRSQARGHARSGEAPIKAITPKQDDALEAALKELRLTGNRAAAAKSANISPERFRRFLRESVEAVGRGRSLKIIDNRPRDWKVVSNGEVRDVTLRDFEEASLNGQHLAAINNFLTTRDRELLLPFEGRAVTDVKGKHHSLETDPNEICRIAALDDGVFHEIYRLVLTGA